MKLGKQYNVIRFSSRDSMTGLQYYTRSSPSNLTSQKHARSRTLAHLYMRSYKKLFMNARTLSLIETSVTNISVELT